jgi:gliding motility-associated-like protein
MKQLLRNRILPLLFLLPLLLASREAAATHLYGADFYYTWNSGTNYTVTLVAYGDCSGASFSGLNGMTPQVQIYKGASLQTTISLSQVGSGVEVTPVCAAQASNTVCSNSSSTIPGVKRYIYQGNVTLGSTATNWRFHYTGNNGGAYPASGRSNSITNVNSGTTMQLDAYLDNTVVNNSSVNYSTIPTPFFCINKPAAFNPGAIDPNGDSLSFALVTALGGVTYITPFTATAPMATSSFSFNTSNGQMNFTPNAVQRALVVEQVNEYHNGVLVGTSMREMTIVVLNTCNNNPPTGTISNTSTNIGLANPTDISVCASAGTISFNINPIDSDGDHINMQVAGLPPGASFTIFGNNSYYPIGSFSWNVSTATPGTYNFFITFTDDGCSISSKQTLAYTITVYGNPLSGFTLLTPATCSYKAKYSLTPGGGGTPDSILIYNSTFSKLFTNVSSTVTDSLWPGTYTIHTVNSIGCSYDTTIVIASPTSLSGSFTFTTPTCIGGTNGSITVTGINGTSPYTYAIGSGSFSSTNTFTGLSAGTYAIHIKDGGGCTKDTNVILNNPAPIYANVAISKPPCNGLITGAINVSGYNSVSPYTYALNGGSYSSSGVFTGLASGTDTIHIKNALGCIKDTIVTLPDSIRIQATITISNALCNGDANGIITVVGSGTYAPYTYALGSGSFSATNVFTGLAANTYSVHIKDSAQCYFDTTVTVSQPTVVVASATVTANASCYGGANGVITASGSGGTPPYTYSINSGGYSVSNVFSGLAAGTYTVNVKDANGCIKSTTATISQPTKITIGWTYTSPNCYNTSDGSFTLSASGGTPGYTYSVDGLPYQISSTITGMGGGTHVLHIKDTLGCIVDSNVTLPAPTRVTPIAAVRQSTCNTLGDGKVTLSGSGGTPGYTYALGPGGYSSTNVFSSLAAGTYTFHVKDSHGCISDTIISITDSLTISSNVTVTNVTCYNQNNGSITVTGTGGQSPYTYALGSGSYGGSGSFSPLANGPYVLHIKDANGCIKDTNLTITQPTLLKPTASVTNILCNGASTGAVTIGATGGTPGYTYAQGSGSYGSSGTFTGLTAGTYTFHVKDANSCISDTTLTITQPTPVAVSIVKTNVLCNGGTSGTVTVTASGGTPGYTYAYDANAYTSSNVLTGLNAGIHTIHTKDANGCIKDTNINITEPTSLLLGYTAVTPLCNGDANGSITITASGGTPPYLYSLNSGPFTGASSYASLGAGTYNLHIKDANNCTKDSTITLTEPTILALTLSVSNVLCNGGNSGSVTVTANGGTPAYTYAIDAGTFGSSNIFNGLTAGLHTVHLKDANGCTKDSTFSITQPSRLNLTYNATQPLCNGNGNGSITIVGIGGTTPYTYALNGGSFGSVATFNGLSAGADTLHIKDANGCTKDSIITLGQPALLTLTATKTDVLCNGGNSGTVTVTGAGGITPYSYGYDSNPYGSSNVLTGLTAGIHTIHLKDANGCIKDTNITITEPTRLVLGYTMVQPLCFGNANGSITINASGGTPTYTYSVNTSPFSTSPAYTGLTAGTYTLHLKDANGCTKDSTVTLGQPTALGVSISVTNVACNGNATGAVTVTAIGGTTPYTYALNSGSFGSGATFTGLTAGLDTIHIKDANGCLKDTIFSITQPSRLNLTYNATQPLCYGNSNGSVTIVGIGGTTPYTYAFNGGTFGAAATFNGLSAGVDTLHIKDANGCTKDSIITLGQPPALTVSLAVTNVLCNGGNSATITVTGGGGITPYTYAVDASAYSVSNVLSGLNAGSHTVHLKDANGCIKDTTVTITQPAALSLTYTITQPLCNNDANGSITVSGTGGTAPYTYSLNASPFSVSGVYSGLSAGTYTLHVKDANGCTKDSTITLSQPTALAFTFSITSILCNGDSAAVTVTASGGTPAYTYAVDARPFGSSNTLTGILAGVHTVHLKDANGCTKDSTITINQPTKLNLSYTTVSPLCYGDLNGSITIAGNGGTPAYTYALNGGSYGSSGVFTGLGAGVDTLHVKDANGCKRDSIITLTQPAKLAFTLAIQNVLCNGGNTGQVTVTASGGTPSYQYASDGNAFGSSNVLTGLSAGTHDVHLKDANGCVKDTTITITQPAVLSLTYTSTQPLCYNGTNGTITVSGTGGTTPYSYAINAGSFGASGAFTGLNAGTYTLHVKDANGCTKDSTITLSQPTDIYVNAFVRRPRCTPLVNGIVWLYPGGGTPGYTYAYTFGTLNSPYQSSSQFNNLGSGIYTFHIKDANGCVHDTTIGVQDSVFVHANYTVTNVTCYGGTNGSVAITPFGGDPVYTYSVNSSTYSTTNPIINLAAGSYTLHVKDSNGCRLDTPMTITQPPMIVPSVTITQPLCYGASNGTIQAVAFGGTPGYSYALGTGAYNTTGTFSNIAAGTYTLHTKDNNGCVKDTSITVGQPTKLVIDSIRKTDLLCYGDNSGTAIVYASGGTSPYTYAFDAGGYGASNALSGFNVGNHIIHVKDNNGCIKDSTLNFKQPSQLYFTVPGVTPPTCEGMLNGSITIAAIGGTPGYMYAMDNGTFKPVNLYNGLGEGTYIFHIQDSNKCTHDTSITLTGYPHIVIGQPELTPPTCYGLNNGIIDLNVTGGVPPLTYHIVKPNITNNTGIFDTLRKGTYTFQITDAKGCHKDTAIFLDEPPLLNVKAAATPNDCVGPDDNGSLLVTVTGGTEPYTYAWSSGQNSALVNGVGNGAYWVVVTDANLCSDSALAVVGYDNCCRPFLPDAFTPNGDGRNDIFRLRWKGDVYNLNFSVYNRYGQRVFVSYQPDVGWDGTYGGKPCDMDVYFYDVKFDCGKEGNRVEYKGDVTLIR